MRLRRVQVPDFRVLKNVDIEFEIDFIPQVFPLGSQNGGGKSTLLQLIFILLHCSTVPSRLNFLQELIKGFAVHDELDRKTLAVIEILENDKEVKLDFFVCKSSYINHLLSLGSKAKNSIVEENDDDEVVELSFSVFSEQEKIKEDIRRAEDEKIRLKAIRHELKSIDEASLTREKQLRLERLSSELRKLEISSYGAAENTQTRTHRIRQNIEKRLEAITYKLASLLHKQAILSAASGQILEILSDNNILYICNYSLDENEIHNGTLLCHFQGVGAEEIRVLLNRLSSKVSLAAPSTQVFIFLPQMARELLFKKQKDQYLAETYYSHIQQAKDRLPGLFTYDFLAIDVLIDSFKAARDRDFEEVIQKGKYGNHYTALLNSLNSILSNKRLSLNSDLSGVTFKTNEEDGSVELSPEDLSHGELKRLSIYMWLAHQNIENSIVLMDEIEIALHPDWQYQIVSDLIQWSPTNQYILATHSYELCQAVTPAHVKELEPRLLSKQNN